MSTRDSRVSVARARVEPRVTTKAHHLDGLQEIYVITEGEGRVFLEGVDPADVLAGDVVVIPPGKSQKIMNIGEKDLVFYCVCTPAFAQQHYHNDEE